MKNLKIIFIALVLLFSYSICEVNETTKGVKKKLSAEKEKELKQKLSDYFQSLDLENKKLMSKDEFLEIVHNSLKILFKVADVSDESIEKGWEKLKIYALFVFTLLSLGKENINIESIIQTFASDKIEQYLKNFLEIIGFEQYIKPILEPLLKILEALFRKKEISTEL